jgi:energy-coupling factor transporter ATP-binding protein EcfA2
VLNKIIIKNYRAFENFTLEFTPGLNILVGDNDAGKTTLLEAVHLALTSRVHGRLLAYQLSPHMVNQSAATRYVAALARGERPMPPEIVIDLYLDQRPETAVLVGTNNPTVENAPGLRVKASFSQDYVQEYERFVEGAEEIRLVPTEYYKVEWLSFAGNAVTSRGVPATASLIDAAAIRLQSGADQYIQQIIDTELEVAERVELARSYRSLRESFSGRTAITAINTRLSEAYQELSDKALSLSIDVSQKTSWESNLVPHLDDLPLQFVGNGAQHVLKMLLALNRSVDACHAVLIEEPENHQSPASLSALVRRIDERCQGKQVVMTTHSSFVLNKLGLDNLVLVAPPNTMRLTDLPGETLDYFKKLSGYDTLRVVLARRMILVEGPSDELIVQRAFKDRHGVLPLEAGVDVINVRGLSFKRFLDIAGPLGKRVAVITDNDGADPEDVKARYADYTGDGSSITIHVGDAPGGATLEPQIVAANDITLLNELFGTNAESAPDLSAYMVANKTACALQVLEADMSITMPSYIDDAVA